MAPSHRVVGFSKKTNLYLESKYDSSHAESNNYVAEPETVARLGTMSFQHGKEARPPESLPCG